MSWSEFYSEFTSDSKWEGTEHLVDYSESGLVVKVTIPPKFGLIPAVFRHETPLAQQHEKKTIRECVEFDRATPLEYLSRWVSCNEIFGDDVALAQVVLWSDKMISFVVLQPAYDGAEPLPDEITRFFEEDGWTYINKDPEHEFYYNYAYEVLVVDALPRNCRINDGRLQPFDLIVCRPDEGLEKFLEIYPG